MYLRQWISSCPNVISAGVYPFSEHLVLKFHTVFVVELKSISIIASEPDMEPVGCLNSFRPHFSKDLPVLVDVDFCFIKLINFSFIIEFK